MRNFALHYQSDSAVCRVSCVVGTNFGEKNIVGRELVVQFSKRRLVRNMAVHATDTAAAGTTRTAGFLPRLVFVQLSARPELGSKKII